MSEIRGFFGEYRFLSNFWHSPMRVEGLRFDSGEHFYQALKCTNPADVRAIANLHTPGEAKRAGRQIKIRDDWDDVKDRAMEVVTYNKFLQNPELMAQLLDTQGQLLVESNTWHDNYWGECSCTKCAGREKHNKLGQTLMLVRDLVIEKAVVDF